MLPPNTRLPRIVLLVMVAATPADIPPPAPPENACAPGAARTSTALLMTVLLCSSNAESELAQQNAPIPPALPPAVAADRPYVTTLLTMVLLFTTNLPN